MLLKDILQHDNASGPSISGHSVPAERPPGQDTGVVLEDVNMGDEAMVPEPEAQPDLPQEDDIENDDQREEGHEAAQWEMVLDQETGLNYFYNATTQESSWEAPREMREAPDEVPDHLTSRHMSRGNQNESFKLPASADRRASRDNQSGSGKSRVLNKFQSSSSSSSPRRASSHGRSIDRGDKYSESRASFQEETPDKVLQQRKEESVIKSGQVYGDWQAWTQQDPVVNASSLTDAAWQSEVAAVTTETLEAKEESGFSAEAIVPAASANVVVATDTRSSDASSQEALAHHASWPEWSRMWESEVGIYLYVNNHTGKISRKAPKGWTFNIEDDGKSPLADQIVVLQSAYRGHRARVQTRELRTEGRSDEEGRDTFDVEGLGQQAGAGEQEAGWGHPVMTPKTDTSYSDMFAGITLDDDYDGDDPFAALMGDAMEIQSPSEDVLDDLRASGLDDQDWNRSIELEDAPVDLPTVDASESSNFAPATLDTALSSAETPKSILNRRGSTKKLLIATDDDEDGVREGNDMMGMGPPPEVLIWSALNARATPTGRQVGEWVERVDPESEEVYYANLATGESKWEMPADFDRRSGQLQMATTDEAWEELVSPTGRHLFWYNWSNGERTAETPPALREGRASAASVTLASMEHEGSNRIQAEYLWELLRSNATAVMSCGAWVCLEEATHGDQFYYCKSTGDSQWERPEEWNDAEATPIEEVSRSSASVEPKEENESKEGDAPKMRRKNSSLQSLVHAKKLARTLTMKRKNRSWSCVVSPHDRCLFEYNWDTCLVRKTLNLNAKQVNPMRRFLLQNTTTLEGGMQLGGPRQLPGGTRHLWSLLRARAVETGVEAEGWREYLDELSRELFYGTIDGREWQWERPSVLSSASDAKEPVLTDGADGAATDEESKSVGPRPGSEWRTVKSLEGGTYWIHRETGRKSYVDPAETGPMGTFQRAPTMSSIQSSTPSFQVSNRAILSPKGKKLFAFDDGEN
ncbi:WW domain-binding protein 4 [Hondaea fermentalgiana]|uniref:WW domain-binding protein 4 n=1 Tax=Hondaea fermentalgiana TaxID=2315210 RepID=A0A2R5GNI1_9STRA|nr:WW domain-binding protein 4 [Hondaea fermentalgiana]|eukprot:GBG31298.1 WW domain-binding protein 4 [Hondaea fermentalgiana]